VGTSESAAGGFKTSEVYQSYQMKVTAILTAAGSGSRFLNTSGRSKIPKQFVKINGREVFLYSLVALQRCKQVDEIFVTAERRFFDLIHKLAVKNRITKLTTLVEGGKTRFQSVRNAVYQLKGKHNDLVLIHDAARPNISFGFIRNMIIEAKKFGEIIPALRLNDTIKVISRNYIIKTIDRKSLRAVQTPQIFRYGVLMDSYKKNKLRKDFTDESALVESAGFKVRIIDGLKENIKITAPEDVVYFKSLLR
jgi:2-C-methyl-D-erythritol 4-phosphate cytidylyltransferase